MENQIVFMSIYSLDIVVKDAAKMFEKPLINKIWKTTHK